MPDLYIANCTRQNQIIYFRLDFDEKGEKKRDFTPASQRDIKPGQQVKIRDLHIDQAETIRKQLSLYGLLSVSEIPRAQGIVPFIFNVDKPVKADQIRAVLDHNSGVHVIRGRARREKAAISVSDIVAEAVAKQLAAQQMPVPEESASVDVEFEQLEQSEQGESRVEEGYRMRADAPPPKRATRQLAPRSKRNK